MSETMTTTSFEDAIKANLSALAELLGRAASEAGEAIRYSEANQRNNAIGTIVDLDRVLADAVALHGAAIALHRRARP